jgi:hypothetical protein
MTVQIFTSVVNRPDFVEIQKKLFDKFLDDEYQFNVVDDSLEDQISLEFKTVCGKYGINYYRKSQENRNKNESRWAGARHATETIQWTFDEIIKKKHSKDLILFLDSDMFLLDDFNLTEYMKDAVISGLPQIRGHVKYIWNGIMFFDMMKVFEIDSNLNFSDGNVDGELTDIGGHFYYYFKKNNIIMKETDVTYPSNFNGIDLENTGITKGFNFELHLDGKFLHYRAGTNWHTQENWKSKNDPLTKKAEIFDKIIGDFLNV